MKISNSLIRRFGVLILLVSFIIPMSAQSSGWKGKATFDPIQVPFQGGNPSFAFGIGAYKPVHENVELGFGIQLSESWKFKTGPSFPIFIAMRLDKMQSSFSPTFDFNTGVSINTSAIKTPTYFMNPIIGLRVNKFGVGIGYMGNIALGVDQAKWVSGLNLSFAYYFNYNKTEGKKELSQFEQRVKSKLSPVGKFLKKIDIGLALGVDAALNSIPGIKESGYGWDGVSTSDLTGFGLDLSLLYPVSHKVEMGPMLGIHVNSEAAYMPVAWRTRYNAKQWSFGRFYPWAQLDLGAAASVDKNKSMKSQFLWKPAIGVSLDVRGGKSSLDLGLGYSLLRYTSRFSSYIAEKNNISSLSITLGYQFNRP